MLRTSLVVALVAAPLLTPASQQISPGGPTPIGPPIIGPPPTIGCANTLDQEPLVMFDVTGFTLAGLLHEHLCVYDNGVVTISRVSGGTPLFPLTNAADIAFISPNDARNLHKTLTQAGAFRACDEQLSVADLPMSTVSIFRAGATDDRVHTFSYWIPQSPESQATSLAISAFRDQTFPNF